MQINQNVAPDLDVALTNDNKLVIMVDGEYGEVLAEVTDIDLLVSTLRNLELVQMERKSWGVLPGTMTTAEVELNRRQAPVSTCQYSQSHTRDWCGNPNCREG